ncbi:PfkB family carbohydrate kinase [Orbaceae bacterium ESL0721]|nr:PfkB family carbohydrate kinase [Orbaceae bacterium ESL0721]
MIEDLIRQQRQIVIFGAAVVDLIANIPHLPTKGEDIALNGTEAHIGGSALNIAIALHRLKFSTTNAIPIGSGYWADLIKQHLASESITSSLHKPERDNGWCLALVDKEKERTFLSVDGIEDQITTEDLMHIEVKKEALVSISGYQLIGRSANQIMQWLISLDPTVQILVDFGPRIAEIPTIIINKLLKLNTIFTLNRQEAYYLQSHLLQGGTPTLKVDKIAEQWFQQQATPLIIRVDKEGAYCCYDKTVTHIPAFKTQLVDSIGAGDSHCAGILAGLASGWRLKEATIFANAIASYVVSHKGGDSSPDIDALKHYLAQYNNSVS